MNKAQQMRWTRATVQLFLDVRTAVLNDTLENAFRLPHRRTGANERMRWSPRDAHRMLQVRTAVANGTLADDHTAAERSAQQRKAPQLLDGLWIFP